MLSIFLIITLIFQNWVLAVIVGVSLFATLTLSTVVGFIIPIIIDKLKFDPAIASGPFITTINDIIDRKSTRLNSSHVAISYAVFCLKKKNENQTIQSYCLTSVTK